MRQNDDHRWGGPNVHHSTGGHSSEIHLIVEPRIAGHLNGDHPSDDVHRVNRAKSLPEPDTRECHSALVRR